MRWLKILFATLLTIVLSSHAVALASEQIDVTVTAYTNSKSSTDHTTTASSVRLTKDHNWKVIALSPDLARRFKYGDEFELSAKDKVHHVVYHDTSSKSHKKKVDLLLPSIAACKKFGKVKGKLRPLSKRKA